MLMTLFEADLKGSLVFKKEADNVNYFSDVLRTRDMRIITERNSMASSIFTASQNLFLKALRQRLDKREGILAGYNFDLLLKEILDRKVSCFYLNCLYAISPLRQTFSPSKIYGNYLFKKKKKKHKASFNCWYWFAYRAYQQ